LSRLANVSGATPRRSVVRYAVALGPAGPDRGWPHHPSETPQAVKARFAQKTKNYGIMIALQSLYEVQ